MRISDWSSDVCSSDLQPPAAAAFVIIGVRHRHIIALPHCRDDEHLGKALGIERQFGHRYLGFEARSDHLVTPQRLDRLGHRLAQPPHILPISADRLVAGKRRQFGPFEEMDRTVVARETRLPRSEEHTSELQSLMSISYAV